MTMKTYILIIVVCAVLTSCKTNELYINVLQPAPVTLSPDIKKVGIIDRSIPTDETKLADEIEKIFTLESADLDRDGARESITGLIDELQKNDRFSDVRILQDLELKASGIDIFPLPLSRYLVDSICRISGTDALFSLEKYDTDTRLNYTARPAKVATPFGKIPLPEHEAEMHTLVKTGWRIYDPLSDVIPDEFSFVESLTFHGKGINPVVALSALTGRKQAVREVSRNAGQRYALRILPFTIRVTRDYFVKGTDNFKIARRKAQTGKWNEAGALWEIETNNHSSKIAGRACYNMAIISEINGYLEDALGWAQKAWEDYKIRPALKYVRILENRLYNDDILRTQAQIE
jgi:hypothetical protein